MGPNEITKKIYKLLNKASLRQLELILEVIEVVIK